MIEWYIYYFNVGVDFFEYFGNFNLKFEVNYQVEFFICFEGECWQVGGNVFYFLLIDYIMVVVDSILLCKYMFMSEFCFVCCFINIDWVMQVGFEWDVVYCFNDWLSVYILGAYIYVYNQDWDELLV